MICLLLLLKTPHSTQESNILNGTGESNPNTRADIVYYKTPHDGAMISFSSMSWLGSLSHNNYDNNVSKLMKNVIDGFSKDGPLP